MHDTERSTRSSSRSKPAERSGEGAGVKAAARREEAARLLADEVEALRATCREAVQAYELRVGAQLAAAVDVLRAAAGGKTKFPSQARLAESLSAVRAVKLKPKKGRVKDLARLQQLAEELSGLLGEGS